MIFISSVNFVHLSHHLSDCPRNSLMALSQVDLNDKQ